jgi:hypothetical protein
LKVCATKSATNALFEQKWPQAAQAAIKIAVFEKFSVRLAHI